MGTTPKHIYNVTLYPNSLTTIDKPNKEKILCIKTKEDMEKFTGKYVKQMGNTYDWTLLKSKFGGIEIHNPRDLGDKLFLKAWDVSSGCIWNIDVIKQVSHMGST
jgi:hypothetical protein